MNVSVGIDCTGFNCFLVRNLNAILPDLLLYNGSVPFLCMKVFLIFSESDIAVLAFATTESNCSDRKSLRCIFWIWIILSWLIWCNAILDQDSSCISRGIGDMDLSLWRISSGRFRLSRCKINPCCNSTIEANDQIVRVKIISWLSVATNMTVLNAYMITSYSFSKVIVPPWNTYRRCGAAATPS